MSRREELGDNLRLVHQRIEAARSAADRDDPVNAVIVTKYFPASDVSLLAGLGVGAVGESRHQEGLAKHDACAELGLEWHFIGQLQSNKAAAVAGWADVVQSVDRPGLIAPLARGRIGLPALGVLLQVNLDRGAAGRGGAAPAEIPALVEAVLAEPGLDLRGVMAVAPLGEDPRPAFDRLAEVAADVRRTAPGATWISAGMSGDLEEAIAAGATHVRVGAAVLGNRARPL